MRKYHMALILYIGFFIAGISIIAIAQNMSTFAARFGTDDAGISYIISGIGLGKIASLLIIGGIADKFSRKSFVIFGVVLFIIFYSGFLICTSGTAAFMLAVLAGIAASAFDVATYPALVDAFKEKAETAVIVLKAVMSFGQISYPLMVGYLLKNNYWYGYGFIIPLALLALVAVNLILVQFPERYSITDSSEAAFRKKPSIWIDGITGVVFSYTAFSSYYLMMVWMPRYAQQVLNVAEQSALQTVSYISAGSLLCVIITIFFVGKYLRSVWIIVFYSFLAVLSLIYIYFNPSNLAAFFLGFSAAGGIFQLGIAIINQMFPAHKARATTAFMMSSAIAHFTAPAIAGKLSTYSISYIILFDIGIAFVMFCAAVMMFIRYYKIFELGPDLRLGESFLKRKAL